MWTSWTYTIWLSCTLGPQKRFKLTATCFETRTLGCTDRQRQVPGIIRDNTEVTIRINGIPTAALLDTGSTVSTICESFYEQNLQDVEIQDIGDLFELKCADGSDLPYKGAVELDVISEVYMFIPGS